MDLNLTPEEKTFQAQIREWLKENIPSQKLAPMDTPEGFEEHREWEKVLFEAGWAVPNWPEEFGGRQCSLVEWLIYEEEYWAAGAPGRVSANGVSLLAPTIFEFGSVEHQKRFLPKMASGQEIWAQAWSEPDAGSDLANLSTRAVKEGDWFILNGQKTWCSRGAFADWLFCIVRSDPESERHRGLSYLLVPADAEGIDRRPVQRLDGQPAFAEIFFTDVKVHSDNLLGEQGQGWAVAMATAGSERGLNLRSPGRFMATADRLMELLADSGNGQKTESDLKNFSSRAAKLWVYSRAYKWACFLAASKIMSGKALGSNPSMMKVFWSEMDVELHALAMEMLGESAELMEGSASAIDEGAWLDGYLFALAGPIYAGTNEIQRNIIAERVLGLPRK